MSFTGNLKADIRFKYEIDRVIATLNVSSVRYVRQGGDGVVLILKHYCAGIY